MRGVTKMIRQIKVDITTDDLRRATVRHDIIPDVRDIWTNELNGLYHLMMFNKGQSK